MRERFKLITSAVTLSLVAMLLVLALASEFGSLAWFSSANHVDGEMGISVYHDDIINSVKYYRVSDVMITRDENNVKHNIYKFGFDPSVLSTQKTDTVNANGEVISVQERESFDIPIDMLPYSDLSGDCQILIEIDLSVDCPVAFSAELFSNEYIGNVIKEKIDEKLFDLDPEDLALSGVIRFALFDDVEISADDKAYLVPEDVVAETQFSFIKVEQTDNGEVFSLVNPLSESITLNSKDRKFFIFADYFHASVEKINEVVLEYVDSAEKAAADSGTSFDTIEIGVTNLHFTSDFKFVVSRLED